MTASLKVTSRNPLKYQMSYSECFGLFYIMFAVISLIGRLMALFYSPIEIQPINTNSQLLGYVLSQGGQMPNLSNFDANSSASLFAFHPSF